MARRLIQGGDGDAALLYIAVLRNRGGVDDQQLRAQLERAILHKPEQHAELSARSRSQAARDMNQIGG